MKRTVLLFLMCCPFIYGQNIIQGSVYFKDNQGITPIFGAEIFWKNTSVGTTSDKNGAFSIPVTDQNNELIIRYIGFKQRNLHVGKPYAPLSIELTEEANELSAVEISQKRKSTQKLVTPTANVVQINRSELLKAACCNLSESFETNSSIDVSNTDAVSGTKQIKMLGLASPYLLMSRENIPTLKGASQNLGLSFIPGTWIESIQIIKGAGSVINGYESISGQINTELVKPASDTPILLNAIAFKDGRHEFNAHINKKVSKNWFSGLFIHTDYNSTNNDNNHDGFLDIPTGRQINVMNRWQYLSEESNWRSQILFHALSDKRSLGQFQNLSSSDLWESTRDIKAFNAMAKLGYIWEDMPFQSIGFQGDYTHYQQNSVAGNQHFSTRENHFYFNTVFSSIIDNTYHKFTTGISSFIDQYYQDIGYFTLNRKDKQAYFNIGSYFEYNYSGSEVLQFSSGIRWDYHNQLGTFFTPRIHVKWTPSPSSSFRFSAGRGKRLALLFSENQKILSSNRQMQIQPELSSLINEEIAWNYGVSISKNLSVFLKDIDISIDLYRTDFIKQTATDWETPGVLSLYNVEGKSYANSAQVEVSSNISKGIDLRLAYKYYDIQTDLNSGKKLQILQPSHRFFANISYESTPKNNAFWRADYTFNLIGKQRIPRTFFNNNASFSPIYSLSNLQITRVFSKKWELYFGGENLFNYTQQNPILSAENPFSSQFDAGLIYAPTLGRMLYVGLRFSKI